MAVKTSTATYGTEQDVSAVTTAGAVSAGTITIIFDEADETTLVLELIDRARRQILDYYSNKSS